MKSFCKFFIIMFAVFAFSWFKFSFAARQDVVFMKPGAAHQERQGKGYQDQRRHGAHGHTVYEVYNAKHDSEEKSKPQHHEEAALKDEGDVEEVEAMDHGGAEGYSHQEKKGYEGTASGGVKYLGQQKESVGEINIGINLDSFISGFVSNAKNHGLHYSLVSAPRRSAGADKDVAVFCMNKKRLCFTAVWEKGRDRLFRIAMVTAGDGTQQSARDVVNCVHAFISTITPGLTKDHQNNLMKAMGMPNADMGMGSIVKPDGKRINYEYGRSNKVGVVVIASSVYGGN